MRVNIVEFPPFDFKNNKPVVDSAGAPIQGTEVMFIVETAAEAQVQHKLCSEAGARRWKRFNAGKDEAGIPQPVIRPFYLDEDAKRVYDAN